jgi:hypothetical protein
MVDQEAVVALQVQQQVELELLGKVITVQLEILIVHSMVVVAVVLVPLVLQ